LTTPEIKAAEAYSETVYKALNANLRSGKDLTARQATIDEGLQSALGKTKEFETPVRVYRAMDVSSKVANKLISELRDASKSGAQVSLGGGYVSTTTSRNVADEMGKNMLIIIEARKGLDMGPVSTWPKEKELLMDRGSRFRVSSVQEGGTSDRHKWIVTFEHVTGEHGGARARLVPVLRAAADQTDDGEITPERVEYFTDIGPEDIEFFPPPKEEK